jgi:hypothetical protein
MNLDSPEPDDIVHRSPEAVASELDSEVVILDLSRSAYIGLDGVGARIWELLARPTRVRDIEAALLSEYEVERSRLSSDLTSLLSDLIGRGLVHVETTGA